MTTLQEIIKAVKATKIPRKRHSHIAKSLLGSCQGVIPKGKTSTQVIRELRDNLYDKIK